MAIHEQDPGEQGPGAQDPGAGGREHLIVCGAGAAGLHVARTLAELHRVTVVERDEARLPAARGRLRAVQGDATDPAVLVLAGGQAADALIAATGDDATNLLVAALAKHHLGVRQVVARVNDPDHLWLFSPAAGVDVAASGAVLLARLVQEEVTAGDLVTLLRLRGTGVAVTETTLPPGAAAAGRPASALRLPDGTALTAVVRGGDVLLPARAGALRAGDVLVALCESGREHVLHEALAGRAQA